MTTVVAGDETLVNTTTSANQVTPSTTALSDGGWVVTWYGVNPANSTLDIYQQRYTSAGIATGGEVVVNTTTASSQFMPGTAALADGGWVVTWEGINAANGVLDIYQQRYTSAGAATGGEVIVNTTIAGSQYSPSAIALADGGWVVTWEGLNPANSTLDIYQQRYTSAGVATGGEVVVNATTAGSQDYPSIATLSDHGWVVTWQGVNPEDGKYDIYQQRYTSAGVATGGEIVVNATTEGIQGEPSITALSDGGWVVTWEGVNPANGTDDIYQQRYTAAGAATGGEVVVNATTAGNQYGSSTIALSDGGWVVTWQGTNPANGTDDIYQQRYTSAGVATDGEFVVNTTTAGGQNNPSTTALADGGWVVTWYGANPANNTADIFQRRFSPNEPPSLTGSLSATVAEGASHTITTSELGYNDPDDVDSGVTFTVSGLSHGTVLVNGVAASSFTGTELAAGKVAFVHDGSETTAAGFNVAVEDGNEDNSTPTSQAFSFTVTPVNDAPTDVALSASTVVENQRGATIGTFSATDADGDALTYTLAGGGGLFTIDATTHELRLLPGQYLNYENSPQSFVTLDVSDGTTTVRKSFQITVVDAQEAPALISAVTFPGITEDDTANAGQMVGDLFGPHIIDEDANALKGIAVSGLSSTYGTWQYSLDGGATWQSVGSVSNASALLLGADDRIRFLPDGIHGEKPSITYHAWDQTSGTAGDYADISVNGGATAFSGTFDNAFITVTAVNDAPVLTGTTSTPTFTEGGAAVDLFSNVSIDTVESGQKIKALTLTVSGLHDGSAEQLVIGGTTISLADGAAADVTGQPSFHYAVSISNGVATIVLSSDAGLSSVNAQTLVDGIAYKNASDNPDTSDRIIKLTSIQDDGGTASGSDTALLSISSTVHVAAVDVAPTLSATGNTSRFFEDGSPFDLFQNVSANTNDSGQTFSKIVVQFTAPGVFPASGPTEYLGTSGGDIALVNGQDTLLAGIGTAHVSVSSAWATVTIDGMSLDASELSNLVDSFSYYFIGEGFADSPRIAEIVEVSDSGGSNNARHIGLTASLIASSTNDTPIGPATGTLSPDGTEDNTYTVDAATLLTGFTDADDKTLSVTGLKVTGGSASVADDGKGGYTVTPDKDFNGDVTLTYTVTDGHGGNITVTRTLAFDAVNDAPTGPATGTLSPHGSEDSAYTVSSATLLTGFKDVDDKAISVTDVKVTGGNASVVYDGNGGYTITPAQDFNGDVTLTYTVTDGHGGDTTVSRTLSFDAVNDAPVANGSATLAPVAEDTANPAGDTVKNLFGANFSDVDGNGLAGVAITVNNATGAEGSWQYYNGSQWVAVGTPSSSFALALAADAKLRFLPAAGYNGAAPTLSAYLVDDSNGPVSTGQFYEIGKPGGGSRYSENTVTLSTSITSVNDAPTGPATGTLSPHGTEDNVYTVDAATLLTGFTDADDKDLSVTDLKVSAGNASVAGDGNGGYTVTPAQDFNGDVTLTYTVTDGHGGNITVTRTLTFDAVNDAPTGPATGTLSPHGTEDNVYTVSGATLLTGFTDADDKDLSVTDLKVSAGNASVAGDGNGGYTVTPAQDFNGDVTLTYTVTDGHGGNTTVTRTLTFDVVNDAPTGPTSGALSPDGTEDASYTVSAVTLLAGFKDADDKDLSLVDLKVTAGNAAVADNGNGSYTVTPAADFNGDITLTYTVTDGHGGNTKVTRTLTFDAVNDAPTGPATGTLSPDGTEDSVYALSAATLLTGFSDADDKSLSVIDLKVTGGRAALAGDSKSGYTVTPDKDFNGDVTLTYTVTDGHGGNIEVTRTLTFDAVNDAPVASGSAILASIAEDTADPAGDTVANLFGAHFKDVDGDDLAGVAITVNNATATEGVWQYYDGASWKAVGTPSSNFALLLAADAKVRFVPAADFSGPAPTLSAYLIDNSSGPVLTGNSSEITSPGGSTRYSGDPVTLSTSITAVNDAPVLTGALSATVAEGASHTIITSELGFSDPDDVAAGVTFTVSSLINGTLVVDGKAATSFTGAQLAAGKVALVHDGSETNSASFKVSVEDGNEDSSTPVISTFTFKVDAINDAPTGPATGTLSPDGTEDTAYTVSAATLLTGFSDADDKSLSVTDLKVTGGNAAVTGNSKSGYTVTPAADFNGDVTLTYTVTDGHGGNVTVTRTLTIDAINDAPTGPATGTLSPDGAEDTAYTVSAATLLTGFSDADDKALSVTDLKVIGGNASVTGDSKSGYTVTPAADFNGDVTLTYTVTDGHGGNITISRTLTIDAVNDAPVLTGTLSATIAEGTSHTITTSELGYSDPDDVAAGVTFTVSDQTNGTLLVDGKAATSFTGAQLAAGLVAFAHDGSETSSAGFNVSVEDGNEDGSTPASQAFSFKIDAVNDAPVLTGTLSAIVAEGASHTITTSELGYSDPDDVAAGVTFTISRQTNGTLMVDGKAATSFTGTQLAAGLVAFVHDGSETGSAGFNVSVEDGNEDSSTPASQAFSFKVGAINDAPVLTGTLADQHASEDSAFSFALPAGIFTDADPGDVLTYTATLEDGDSLPTWLTFDAATKTFSGTPANGDVDTLSIKVTATDGSGSSVSGAFQLTVDNTDDAPVLLSPLSNQDATEGTSFTFAMPADTFGDEDVGDVLTYRATLANGDPLPSWLVFDTTTQTFSGTPQHSDIGSISVTVIATDQDGLSASNSFDIAVAGSGGGLGDIVLSNSTVKENSHAGTVIGTLSVPDATPGDDLTYTLSRNPDNAFAVVDGKLVVADGADLDFETRTHYQITVRAAESDGSRFRETFTIDITNVVETPKGTPKNDILIGDSGNNDLHGRQGDDVIKGMGGDDRLRSDGGNDRFTGNSGADVFFFGPYSGHDVVEDFDPDEGDRINLKHSSGIEGFKDLMKHHIDVHGSGVLITADDSSTMLLKHVKIDDLRADDFIF